MQDNSRRKPNTNRQKAQSATESNLGDAASGSQYGNTRTPFYDDPNHVAYGWQQMTALPSFPGLHTLVRGTQGDPPLSTGSRPQTRPVNELQRVAEQSEPSGFNPHPRRSHGPRRPPSSTEAYGRGEHDRSGRDVFKLAPNPLFAKPGVTSVEGVGNKKPQARSALNPKDVNQKLRAHMTEDSISTSLKLTGDLHEKNPQHRAERLVVDELENTRRAARDTERMSILLEEPAPLRIQKKRTDLDDAESRLRSKAFEQARVLRAKQQKEKTTELPGGLDNPESDPPKSVGVGSCGTDTISSHDPGGTKETMCKVNEPEGEETDSLVCAITDWQISASDEELTQKFKHRSAIPPPLDLAAIRTAKQQKTKLIRSEAESKSEFDGDDRNSNCGAKAESIRSFATGMSSDFETLNIPSGNEAEHNGSRRRWYKGFRRSE
ncbi:hypothetical protein M3J09_000051 [Ascochyta lentis]